VSEASGTRAATGLHPALAFLCVLLAGIGLERWPGPPFAVPGRPLPQVAGAALAVLALALAAWGFLALRRAHTPVEPGHTPRSLVTDGPYRFTRNPLYLGQLLLLLGLGLAAFPWLLVGVAVQALLPAEEARIAAGFGVVFEEYRNSVRRWL
jgi:protein-S-isoprenylcysteine O-methyltransferase Ste14